MTLAGSITDTGVMNIPKNENEFRFQVNNALYLSVNAFSTKVLIENTIFTSRTGDGDRHFTWSSEPRDFY